MNVLQCHVLAFNSTVITFEESESTVLQLHADTLQAVHHHWDIEQGQDHWLVEGGQRGGGGEGEVCEVCVQVCVCLEELFILTYIQVFN